MLKTRAIGHYSAAEVGGLAGVSPRRIGSWARYGIVPSISSRPRVYSYADAGEAVLAHYLIEQKLAPRDVRTIVERLRERYGPWPLASAPIEHHGKLVVVREGDDLVFDVLRHREHGVIGGTLIDLKAVRDALQRGGWVALKHPRQHVEVDPERHSGRPVVRGRRLATAMVADMADEPGGWSLLREDYELTDEQIEDAVGYEKDLEALVA